MRKQGIQREVDIVLGGTCPINVENVLRWANMRHPENELSGNQVELAQTARRWTEILAKQSTRTRPRYGPLRTEINGALKDVPLRLHPQLDAVTMKAGLNAKSKSNFLGPASKRLDLCSDVADLARIFYWLFVDDTYRRIRRCKLDRCRRFFFSPRTKGPIRAFCSRTCANTLKMRSYRERKKLQQEN